MTQETEFTIADKNRFFFGSAELCRRKPSNFPICLGIYVGMCRMPMQIAKVARSENFKKGVCNPK